MNKVQLVSSCVFISSLLLSNTVSAKQCDELYPVAEGEDYYHIDPTPLAKETKSQINQFAKKLRGKWRGEAMEVECGISNGESLSKIINYDLTAEIEQLFEGDIVLQAEKETREKLVRDQMSIAPEVERLSQGRKIGSRDYSVEFTGPSSLILIDKYRARNFGAQSNGSSRIVHEVKSIALENNRLKINRDVYINGVFVGQQEWVLNRYY